MTFTKCSECQACDELIALLTKKTTEVLTEKRAQVETVLCNATSTEISRLLGIFAPGELELRQDLKTPENLELAKNFLNGRCVISMCY